MVLQESNGGLVTVRPARNVLKTYLLSSEILPMECGPTSLGHSLGGGVEVCSCDEMSRPATDMIASPRCGASHVI